MANFTNRHWLTKVKCEPGNNCTSGQNLTIWRFAPVRNCMMPAPQPFSWELVVVAGKLMFLTMALGFISQDVGLKQHDDAKWYKRWMAAGVAFYTVVMVPTAMIM